MNTNTTDGGGSLVSRYTRVAMDADAAFSRALKDAGMDRWETPRKLWTPAIHDAYKAKIQADEHMRQAWVLWRR